MSKQQSTCGKAKLEAHFAGGMRHLYTNHGEIERFKTTNINFATRYEIEVASEHHREGHGVDQAESGG